MCWYHDSHSSGRSICLSIYLIFVYLSFLCSHINGCASVCLSWQPDRQTVMWSATWPKEVRSKSWCLIMCHWLSSDVLLGFFFFFFFGLVFPMEISNSCTLAILVLDVELLMLVISRSIHLLKKEAGHLQDLTLCRSMDRFWSIAIMVYFFLNILLPWHHTQPSDMVH